MQLQLSRDTIRERLSPIGLDPFPISLQRPLQNRSFSRPFIRSIYGGNIQEICPRISDSFYNNTGIRDFLYLNPRFHPHAPQVPGAPGLYFSVGRNPAGPWDELMTVFTRLDSNVWCYMGLYQMSPVPSLTQEEWAAQSEEVQTSWATAVCRDAWGEPIRARIACRRILGTEPTDQEEDMAFVQRWYEGIRPEDVRQAFLDGEESLTIWTMKCVGYNSSIQLKLFTEFQTWTPPPRTTRRRIRAAA